VGGTQSTIAAERGCYENILARPNESLTRSEVFRVRRLVPGCAGFGRHGIHGTPGAPAASRNRLHFSEAHHSPKEVAMLKRWRMFALGH